MARSNTSRVYPVALSPARCAQALEINPNVIYAAIKEKKLGPVYSLGLARRVMVSDLEAWVRTYWRKSP